MWRPREGPRTTEGRPRDDRGKTEGRPREDRGKTEGRPREDRGTTEGRPREDRGKTEGRPREDRGEGGDAMDGSEPRRATVSGERSHTRTYRLPAPIDTCWHAFTDPAARQRWFGIPLDQLDGAL